MTGRLARAALLTGVLLAWLPGCWVVVGESFDGYEAQSTAAPLGPYVTETRPAKGGARSYLLARPDPTPPGLPLVFSLHAEGQTGADMRAALPLEKQATSGAVFVYPNSLAGMSFDFNSYAGRTEEALLVGELITTLADELKIDKTRVFLAGWDDGAIMANALGCRLGAGVVRGVAIEAGTLYPSADPPDFNVNDTTGASCALPHALLVWGVNDPITELSIESGRDARNIYLATQQCSGSSAPWPSVEPCISYAGCTRQVVWCEIPGLGHDLWPEAARAMWSFFAGLK